MNYEFNGNASLSFPRKCYFLLMAIYYHHVTWFLVACFAGLPWRSVSCWFDLVEPANCCWVLVYRDLSMVDSRLLMLLSLGCCVVSIEFAYSREPVPWILLVS
ncbi:hypothetical protein OIU77_023162 [Salix suchowensis]|uniref:Uncharacterized protein n=1 Tax=Salix suchowensis TaxID=1278906 RepID=A0ABQ9C2U6_9ROSI|nr:hypothetical protein OIU77_023162 [Salix suchowensis]